MTQFRMPAEWFVHQQTFMAWPHRIDNWRLSARPAQLAYLSVAMAIAEFEPVAMCVSVLRLENASDMLQKMIKNGSENVKKIADNIRFLQIDSDDAWIRDHGPTFVFDTSVEHGQQKLYGVDWNFNAWGNMYTPFHDLEVATCILSQVGIERVSADFVLEGGSIHSDGEGTILTTEECLLHPNRNPHLTKLEIEQRLLHYLGGEKVIWLPRGLAGDDDTNGHIDNICCFSKPGEVLLSWTDDASDPQYARSLEALRVLESCVDARGRRIQVVKLPIPPAMYYAEEDLQGLISQEGAICRKVGERLAASYVNFYIANGGIICPQFGHDQTDQQAIEILSKVFPNHQVRPVMSKEILLGGGNIHCITQQQPKALAL
jgi:agmatine deiminase